MKNLNGYGRGYDYIPGDFVYGENVYVPEEYMDEQWWYIEGIPGYMVSDYGRVWSIKTHQFIKVKPMDSHGHLGVCLYVNGKCYYEYIHRLMAKAFIPNPCEHNIVRHLDDIPNNNDLNNLAWGTQKDNQRDSIKNGTNHFVTEEEREMGLSKLRTPIVAINIENGEKMFFKGQGEASRSLKVHQANIWKVLNGKRKYTGKYRFEYLRKEA